MVKKMLIVLTKRFQRAICLTFFSLLICGIAGDGLLGKEQTKGTKTLNFPDSDSSIITLEPSIAGMTRFKDRLFLFVSSKSLFITTPFNKEGKTREERFGKLTDSARKTFKGNFQGHAGVAMSDRVLVLDGVNLALGELDGVSAAELAWRSFPWDVIKPPRDRGGEGTTPEIREFRRKFRLHLELVEQPRFLGITPLPADWHQEPEDNKSHFIVTTKAKEAFLGIMSCTKSDISSCALTRGCYVEGGRTVTPESIAGVAISPKRKLIFVGDRIQNQLRSFRFHSCFHITEEKTITLPPQILGLSNIFIDEDDQLWVTTERPDNYNNSSVFFWKNDQW